MVLSHQIANHIPLSPFPTAFAGISLHSDQFCSVVLQGGPLHNSICPPAGAPVDTYSDYRGKGKRSGSNMPGVRSL